MKDLLCSIVVTAPVFHAEMSELKAELERNTTQTTAGRTTKWREEAAMNSINKIKWCQQQQLQQRKQLPQVKEASVDERLTVFHCDHGPRVPFRNVRVSCVLVVKKICQICNMRNIPVFNGTVRSQDRVLGGTTTDPIGNDFAQTSTGITS